MVKKTTYTDREGNKKIGYIKDGVAYRDPNCTTKVETGAVVHTESGDYYKGSELPYGVKIDKPNEDDDTYTLGGKRYKTHYNSKGEAYADGGKTTPVPTGASLTKNGAEYYKDATLGEVPTLGGAMQEYNNSTAKIKEGLALALSAQNKATALRTRDRLRVLKAREKQVAAEKKQADRLSYHAYLQAINPYGVGAERAAALGLSNSGYSETSLTALANTYQQALAGNEKARSDAMAELLRLSDQAIAEGNREKYNSVAAMYNTLYNFELNRADKMSDMGITAANALEDKRVREEERAREDKIRAEENSREDKIRAEENAREDKIRAEERAREDKKAAQSAAKKSSGTTTSSGSAVNKNRVELAQTIAKYILDDGYTIPEVAAALGITEAQVEALLYELYK